MIYDLKEKLYKYSSEKELLRAFRIGVDNELKLLNIHLESIHEEVYSEESELSDEEKAAAVEKTRFEVDRAPFDEILPILIGLNISIDRLPKYPKKVYLDGYFQETVFCYDYYDFIKLLDELDDYMYFITMIYIMQNLDDTEVFGGIPDRVKNVLRQLNIRIPKYSKTVFIAMSFNPDLKSIRNTISKVVKNNGFSPVVIDSKEHNNQIVPEIFHEISKADFVIADLTDHKAGVYYEAGYAKGVGKQVIFTCEKEHFKDRHFDVAQTNTIVWEDEEDLKRRLNSRIEAMYLLESDNDEEPLPW